MEKSKKAAKNTPKKELPKPNKRILRKPEVQAIFGLSDVTIYRMEKAGKFPKRLQLGGNSVGWLSTEIDEHLTKLAAEREE
jgi:prophage regulatory protein